jgi:transposase-like protein
MKGLFQFFDYTGTSRRQRSSSIKLLKSLAYVPRVIITDQRKSYGAAVGEILPGAELRQHRYLNTRTENSHQPKRPRRMQGFKSSGQAQRFLAAFDPSPNTSAPDGIGFLHLRSCG